MLLGCWQYLRRHARPLVGWFEGEEKGTSAIEVVVGLVILGLVGISYLGGVATGTKATFVTKQQAIAESLVRSEAEYVKSCAYQYGASEYPVDSTLTIPEGWVVPPPVVEPVHGSDDGIQTVTVTAEHRGDAILSIVVYKVAR